MIAFILLWVSIAGTTLVLTGISGYIVLNSRHDIRPQHEHEYLPVGDYGPFYEAMREKE